MAAAKKSPKKSTVAASKKSTAVKKKQTTAEKASPKKTSTTKTSKKTPSRASSTKKKVSSSAKPTAKRAKKAPTITKSDSEHHLHFNSLAGAMEFLKEKEKLCGLCKVNAACCASATSHAPGGKKSKTFEQLCVEAQHLFMKKSTGQNPCELSMLSCLKDCVGDMCRIIHDADGFLFEHSKSQIKFHVIEFFVTLCALAHACQSNLSVSIQHSFDELAKTTCNLANLTTKEAMCFVSQGSNRKEWATCHGPRKLVLAITEHLKGVTTTFEDSDCLINKPFFFDHRNAVVHDSLGLIALALLRLMILCEIDTEKEVALLHKKFPV